MSNSDSRQQGFHLVRCNRERNKTSLLTEHCSTSYSTSVGTLPSYFPHAHIQPPPHTCVLRLTSTNMEYTRPMSSTSTSVALRLWHTIAAAVMSCECTHKARYSRLEQKQGVRDGAWMPQQRNAHKITCQGMLRSEHHHRKCCCKICFKVWKSLQTSSQVPATGLECNQWPQL